MNYPAPIVEGKQWEGMRSRGNALIRNVIVGGADDPVKLTGGEYATISSATNSVTKEDPGFVEMKNENFLLKPAAKVIQMIPGFEPIPFDKMGLYKELIQTDIKSILRKFKDRAPKAFTFRLAEK